MAVSYKNLWKLLIDKDLKKKDLAELQCTFDDIVEVVPDEKH